MEEIMKTTKEGIKLAQEFMKIIELKRLKIKELQKRKREP
jgi:hypothetical protein